MQIGRGLPACLVRRAMIPLAVAALGCGDGNDPPVGGDGPTILLLNPRGVPVGQVNFALSVYGAGFVSGAELRWNGQPRQTSVLSPTQLEALILAGDVAAAGSAVVTVRLPDGTASGPSRFTIGTALEPDMVLQALSPEHAIAGSDTTEVTVTGSGFVPGAMLFLDGEGMPTEFVGPTSLRASVRSELLNVQRTLQARVGIGGFWVSSVATPWEVRAEAPQAATLDPGGVGIGSADLELRVHGSRFAGNSVVLLDGTEVPTTFVNGTELRAVLPEAALKNPATLGIAVRTPTPGGGLSAALNFSVTAEAPLLSPLPLEGLTAGHAFTLVVQGQHFTAGTVVEWNGSERATTWRNGRRLFASIPLADVSSPGTAAITVHTPNFPASAPRTLTIHPVPVATVTSAKTLALPAPWLTTDPVSGRLFATVSGSGGPHGNTVAEIDPDAPGVVTSTFVGSEPSVVEASDNGQYLYVGLDGAGSVRRVALPGLVPGMEFSLGQLTAGELHVKPGAPGTVAVARRTGSNDVGLLVYDEGVARPTQGPLLGEGHGGYPTFGWAADGTAIFGYDFETSGFEVRRLAVGPDVVREVWAQAGLISSYYVRIQVAGDQIYGGEGSVVDADLRERLGSCNMFGWFTVDRALGRAFYWSDNKISVCDLATYRSLGELDLPVTSNPHPASRHNIVRWGLDGLAFSDGEAVYLVRTPLAAP
jgi:hypothetical protein